MATATLSTNSTSENPSRRTLLTGAATLPVVALAIPANAATGLTDPAIAAFDEWKRLSDEANAADLAFEHLFDTDRDAYWKALEQHRKEWDHRPEREALWIAVTTPAVSLEGLRCKALLAYDHHGSPFIEGSDGWTEMREDSGEQVLKSLLLDLQRMAGATA